MSILPLASFRHLLSLEQAGLKKERLERPPMTNPIAGYPMVCACPF
uniref:Uncharacterized protein n=1 Tax=Utricularia reniformis TaxID=192314 RepID=A0A1Y0AZX8_9LAMI|nr:hypothetical protein AEK19_MT0430 [Utricularia reniformis]ART30693.1 hypothetical protein AEK19_MT0430 [Utricularia reniformis]